jgi:hypothetical protein
MSYISTYDVAIGLAEIPVFEDLFGSAFLILGVQILKRHWCPELPVQAWQIAVFIISRNFTNLI